MVARGGSARGSATKPSAIPQVPWNAVRPAPIVLVSGVEDALADRAISMLREFLRNEDPSLEVVDIAAGSYVRGELFTLASPSLFGEPRLVRVFDVQACSDDFIVDAVDYVGQPADGTTVVLRHKSGVRGKKLLDAVRASSVAVEVICAELKQDGDKLDFIRAEVRAAGGTVDQGALRRLLGAFSGSLEDLSAAVRQLLADSTGVITEALVEKYYGGRVETNSFEVIDLAIAGRYGAALIALRHALESGVDPVPMVAAFGMKLRAMARVAGQRGSDAQLASQHGMQAWQVQRARRDASGWTDEGVCEAIAATAQADAAVKGAERDPVFALERLVATVASRGLR